MLGKKRRWNVRKSVFYIRTNTVFKKWGEKCGKQSFQKHTYTATKKVGKKIVGKKYEKSFFIFARLLWPKYEGKKRAKQFFQKHTNSATKKVGKKRWKKKKSVFYIRKNIVKKNGGKENHDWKIFTLVFFRYFLLAIFVYFLEKNFRPFFSRQFLFAIIVRFKTIESGEHKKRGKNRRKKSAKKSL